MALTWPATGINEVAGEAHGERISQPRGTPEGAGFIWILSGRRFPA